MVPPISEAERSDQDELFVRFLSCFVVGPVIACFFIDMKHLGAGLAIWVAYPVVVYLVGFLPAVFTAFWDHYLARKRLATPIHTVLSGAGAATFVTGIPSLIVIADRIHRPPSAPFEGAWHLAVVGFSAGFVCSAIATAFIRWANRRSK